MPGIVEGTRAGLLAAAAADEGLLDGDGFLAVRDALVEGAAGATRRLLKKRRRGGGGGGDGEGSWVVWLIIVGIIIGCTLLWYWLRYFWQKRLDTPDDQLTPQQLSGKRQMLEMPFMICFLHLKVPEDASGQQPYNQQAGAPYPGQQPYNQQAGAPYPGQQPYNQQAGAPYPGPPAGHYPPKPERVAV